MTLASAYRARVSTGLIEADRDQLAALQLLEELGSSMLAGKARLGGLLGKSRRSKSGGGLYLWGGVGRGKSMLMDLFHENAPIREKTRMHFLEFMQSVHEDLHEIRKGEVEDAVLPAADAIAGKFSLLCLDELQIDDIADAMIVGRLFKRLFERKVTVIATSNRNPDDLYLHGLNRDRFVPFINLIKKRMRVHLIGGTEDHRQGRLSKRKTWFVPADADARKEIDEIWMELTGGKSGILSLAVKGRRLVLPRFANGAARFNFAELCGSAFGPADYLALAGAVRVLFLEDIPLLGHLNRNETRRFVMLVDALYDAGIIAVMSAAAAPEGLHQGGAWGFDFDRTSSRLAEMQSSGWGAAFNESASQY